MFKQVRRIALLAPAAALVLGLVTGGAGTAAAATGSTTASTPGQADPWGWPGSPSKGYLPPHEPAVHGGKVKVGLITAGTVHDHGYYESEAAVLADYAKKHHWSTVVQGSVPPANALSAAENMCSQGVDLLIIGESQLAAAVPATHASVCKDTPVWIFTSTAVSLTKTAMPYMHVATTTGAPSLFATGIAMGLWMKAHDQTTAGFVTGPALSFTEAAAQGYLAGIRYVIKDAKLDAVYTGTLTASGPAITAATSMIGKGIKMIYPYLGASLFATAKYIEGHGGAVPTAGGRWCNHQGVNFAIEQVFNPGYLLAPALGQFAKGKMRVGTVEDFVMGKSKVPSVSFCPVAGVSHRAVKTLKKDIKNIASGKITAAKLVTRTPVPM